MSKISSILNITCFVCKIGIIAAHYYKSFHKNTFSLSNPQISNLSSLTLPDNLPRRLKRNWPRDLLNINNNKKNLLELWRGVIGPLFYYAQSCILVPPHITCCINLLQIVYILIKKMWRIILISIITFSCILIKVSWIIT